MPIGVVAFLFNKNFGGYVLIVTIGGLIHFNIFFFTKYTKLV